MFMKETSQTQSQPVVAPSQPATGAPSQKLGIRDPWEPSKPAEDLSAIPNAPDPKAAVDGSTAPVVGEDLGLSESDLALTDALVQPEQLEEERRREDDRKYPKYRERLWE